MRLNTILTTLTSFLILVSSYAQPIEDEIKKGEKAREQLEQQIGNYDHNASKYLQGIGQRLVANLENPVFDYRYGILDMSDPNALALPGGYIFFSRGILILANSEDELAGIMGHEMIHVHKHHSRKSQKKSIFTGILKIPGAIVGAFSPVAGGILMTPGSLFDAGYSRNHEKQADELGVKLAANSGYDPNALVTIFGKIADEAKIKTGEEEQRSFYDTHPYTPKRVENVNKTIRKLDYSQTANIAADHKAFLGKMEGIVIGDNPANGVFLDSLFVHPGLNFTFAYPNGWSGNNTPKAVGLISADQKAQLMFTVADTVISPGEIAEEFVKIYHNYYGLKPVRNEEIEINGFPAHILSYEGNSDGVLVLLNLLWLNRNDRSYQFALLCIDKYKDVIENMANSLHTMTEAERDLIQITLIHSVQAKEGEDLTDLSTRTGNVLDEQYTALINNVNPNEKLAEGQWIKIGVSRKY